MTEIVGFVISFGLVLLSYWVVPLIMKLSRLAELKQPEGIPDNLYKAFTHPYEKSGSPMLGTLEKLVSLTAYWLQAYELILALLAFKVASKWQSWSGVIQVPPTIDNKDVDPIAYFKLRRQWGASLFLRFMIGTLTNILIGLYAGVIGRWIATYFGAPEHANMAFSLWP